MQCKGCKNPLPKKAEGLRFCIYCGSPIRRVPTWVRLGSPVAVVGLIAALLIAFLPGHSPSPDLVVDNITWSPATASQDQNTTISVTVKNQGDANAAPSSATLYVDNISVGSADFGAILAGGAETKSFSWTAQMGDHTLNASADAGNAILESNETNNARKVTLNVPLLRDNFDDNAINASLWMPGWKGGPRVIETNNRLEVTIPADSRNASSSDQEFSAEYDSVFRLRGDFDVQVDYELLVWPAGDEVRVGIWTRTLQAPRQANSVERTSLTTGDASYGSYQGVMQGATPASDTSGKLRQVRVGSTVSAYRWNSTSSDWVLLSSSSGASTAEVDVHLASWGHDYCFGHQLARVAFDNFAVNRGELLQPPFTTQRPSVGSVPCSLAAGDLNGDGILDIATANYGSNNVSVLLGNGDGAFATQTAFGVGSIPESLAMGDLNGDGILDVTTANYGSNDISVLLGNGDGTFVSQNTFGVGSAPYAIAIRDLNGDGILDIATTNARGYSISVLLGKGDGSFLSLSTFDVGDGPISLAIGDVNGDGILDIAVANCYGKTVSLLQGNGDGTFATQTPLSVGTRPEMLAMGDFNGDGALDIAVANSEAGNISVLLGTGKGSFGSATTFQTGDTPVSLAAGDLNCDGVLDIATANCRSDDVSVLLGNGDGTFASPTAFGVGNYPFSLAMVDVNGDGVLDIAVANYNGNNVSVLLGNGNGTFVM